MRESHCKGFDTHAAQTAAEWVADQGLTTYNEMNDLLLGLIQQKRRRGKAPLTPTERARFHLALYDLDAFRSGLAAGDPSGEPLSRAALAAALAGDDVDLLRFAIQWVDAIVFQPPSQP
jgi:hypothetical protein